MPPDYASLHPHLTSSHCTGGSITLTVVSLVPQCIAGVLIAAVGTAKLTKAVPKVRARHPREDALVAELLNFA